ncbi:MAG: class I SAM-dependent methyltransferase [bacterium]|nr:class I SAM-dependent methyltransferase [bacterium]
MPDSITKHNIRMFTKQVEEYKKYYHLTQGEKFIIDKYCYGKSSKRVAKKVLILGCGAGRTLLPLYEMGYSVTGIDITPKMVEAAKKKVKRLPINIFQMDACDLKFADNTFDIVFFPANSMSCISPDIYTCVAEGKRVMKQKGIFVFSTHSRFNLKALTRFFKGPYANYYGVFVYRSTPLDWWKMKKYFTKVITIPSSSIEVSWKDADYRDIVFKLLPFFDRTTYFICIGKHG